MSVTTCSPFFKSPLFILFAAIVNILIFLLIQNLVTNDQAVKLKLDTVNLVEFIRMDKKQEKIDQKEKERVPEKPVPEQEPPPPDIPKPKAERVNALDMQIDAPDIDVPVSLQNTPYIGDAGKGNIVKAPAGNSLSKPEIDMNVVPTLRIPPTYPRRALRSRIEGSVTVDFTITVDGNVTEPVIIESNPPEIFDDAVLKAIIKWKFDPDVVDGKPVAKRARQEVKFKLE